MAELSRIEKWGDGYVLVSFRSDTRREGTMLRCRDGTSFSVPPDQPNLYLYSKDERLYMKKVTTIIWRLVQGANRKT